MSNLHRVHSKPTADPLGTVFVAKRCLVPAILDITGVRCVTAIDEFIPKRSKSKRRHAPWITNELIKLCRRKKSLCTSKRSKRRGRANDWAEYSSLNNSLKKACNSAPRRYIHNIAEELKRNGKAKSFCS